MQEPLESIVVADSGLIETDQQAEILRLQGLVQEFLSKFQLALVRDEHREIIRNMVSAELSDIFQLLDKYLLLHIAGITETNAGPVENFFEYVDYSVKLKQNRLVESIQELENRVFFSDRIGQAFDLARILYPQNIAEIPRSIDARNLLLQLGLTITDQATADDIKEYYDHILDLMQNIVVITIHQGVTTYSENDPSVIRENDRRIYQLKKTIDDLKILVPIFEAYQDTVVAIEDSILEERDKKALLFLLSSPYKQDLTDRSNWPNGFVRFYDENAEWLTQYLENQPEKPDSDHQESSVS